MDKSIRAEQETRKAFERLEAVDFYFYRWLMYIVTIMILSAYIHVNLNQFCGDALMVLQTVHLIVLLGFNLSELAKRDVDLASIVLLRRFQSVLYRLFVAISAGFFVWLTIGMIIDAANH